MAKKKIGKGAGARDTDAMSKSEIRAYNKEINEFYEANGWRTTLSQYLLSPAQAGVIVKKTRERMAKAADKEKAAKAKARAAKKGAKAKPAAKKKKAPPKVTAKKAKPATASKKKAKAKKTTKKTTKKVTRKKATTPLTSEIINLGVLDFLLGYRDNADGSTPLDTVIADLTAQVRISQRAA